MRFVSRCIAILNTHDSSTAPLLEPIYLYHKNILKSYDISTAPLLEPISLYDKIILNTYDASTAPLLKPISLSYLCHKIRHNVTEKSCSRTHFLASMWQDSIPGVTQQRHLCAVHMTTLTA